MNVFNKVTLESLKKNRTRTIVTIIGIMLSAAMICASTTLVSSMQNFVLRCAIHIDGDWYGAVYDAAYKDYEDIRDSDRVSSAAYAQVLGYAKIDSANERKPYLYVLGGDVASGYFKTMPVHLILGTLPKDSTEIILPEHLTSNGKVNYKLGDTVTLDVGDRTLDGRRLGQDTPVYTYDSETQVEIMSGERLENTEPRTYTVVGIYERPTFEDYSAPGYTALTAADTKSADHAPIHCYFKLHKPAGVYDFMKEMGENGQMPEGMFPMPTEEPDGDGEDGEDGFTPGGSPVFPFGFGSRQKKEDEEGEKGKKGDRKPKKRSESIFAGGLGLRIALQGLLFSVVTLFSFWLGQKVTDTLAGGQTLAFMVLALSQVFHAFNMRSNRSLFKVGIFTNRRMNQAALSSLSLMALVLFVPPVRMVFELAALPGWLYLVGLGLSLLSVPILEFTKAMGWHHD